MPQKGVGVSKGDGYPTNKLKGVSTKRHQRWDKKSMRQELKRELRKEADNE